MSHAGREHARGTGGARSVGLDGAHSGRGASRLLHALRVRLLTGAAVLPWLRCVDPAARKAPKAGETPDRTVNHVKYHGAHGAHGASPSSLVSRSKVGPSSWSSKCVLHGSSRSPDAADGGNFPAPFFDTGNYPNNPYRNPEITGELISRARDSGERPAVEREFEEVRKFRGRGAGYAAVAEQAPYPRPGRCRRTGAGLELLLGAPRFATGTRSAGLSGHAAGVQP